MKSLWEATRDLHHRAEEHPVAKRMMDGSITAQEWADWLHAMWRIHTTIDPHLPLCARRADACMWDLALLLPISAHSSRAVEEFVASLTSPGAILGAAYITVGAHRRGGRVVERAMRSAGVVLPSHHVKFDDPQGVERLINEWRDMSALETGARATFAALYEVMNEIEGRKNGLTS